MSEQDPQATIAILRAENEKLHRMNGILERTVESEARFTDLWRRDYEKLETEMREVRRGRFGTSTYEADEVTMTRYTCNKCDYEAYVPSMDVNGYVQDRPRYCPQCGVEWVRDE